MTQQELERWATARKMKKDFQKTIKAIRGDRSEYPKPMMTEQQMEKNTASVNCGGEWFSKNPGFTERNADLVMNDERFTAFLSRWNATATKEINQRFGVTQIRINY